MESVGNSTIQILDASSTVSGIYPGIFDGTPQDTEGFDSVHIICSADQSGTIIAMHSIDNSVWDISESILYPGPGGTVGTALFTIKALKARWFKTQFVNPGSVSCNLRIQSMLQNDRVLDPSLDTVTVQGHVTVSSNDVFSVSVMNQPIRVFVDNPANLNVCLGDVSTAIINNYTNSLPDPINVNIVNQPVSVSISGIPSVLVDNDISTTILNDVNVTLVGQTLSYVAVSGPVIINNPLPIPVSIHDISVTVLNQMDSSVTVLNDKLNINITQQDLSYVTVSGSVIIANATPISVTVPDISVTILNPTDSCVTVLNDPLNINITQQDLSYFTVSGSVVIANTLPISTSIHDISVTILNTPLPIDICLQSLDFLTISGPVTIADTLSVNITEQDLSYVTVSGPVTIADTVDVSFGQVSVNITQQDLSFVTISGPVTIDDTVRINFVQQDLSFVDVSGHVNIRNTSIKVHRDPIPKVWESNELNEVVVVESSGITIYTLHCMNFAPDYRFVKLYDLSTTINPAVDKPRITIPIVADLPQNLQFPAGLTFYNAMKVRVTRCLQFTDTNMAEEGDVHVTMTYSV